MNAHGKTVLIGVTLGAFITLALAMLMIGQTVNAIVALIPWIAFGVQQIAAAQGQSASRSAASRLRTAGGNSAAARDEENGESSEDGRTVG
ncbi:hypothetical protein [Streptomyces sp. NPDC002328]|uniref:hypothetical protein n=1 Tax=Streptomyces sp. NPDC002328 TaxID=3364642 RepID=UPI0036966EE1